MSDTCTQLKQANEKIRELEGRVDYYRRRAIDNTNGQGGNLMHIVHGVLEYGDKSIGIFINGDQEGSFGLGEVDKATQALIERGRERGVIKDGPDYYDRNRLPHPPKPVVWVRSTHPDGFYYKCDKHGYGDRNLALTFKQWFPLFKDIADVRIWQEPAKEVPYEPVGEKLEELYRATKNGTISGFSASDGKWRALIEYCEQSSKVPPKGKRGSGQGYWNKACGLCVKHRGCKDCPLWSCYNRGLEELAQITDPTEWLAAAKEFRAYIIERCEPKVKEPENPWVYGVWEVLNNMWCIRADGTDYYQCSNRATLEEVIESLVCHEGIDWPGRLKGQATGFDPSTTPDFGVKAHHKHSHRWGAYYNGEFIEGSTEITAERSVEWVRDQLKPKPRTLLADFCTVTDTD